MKKLPVGQLKSGMIIAKAVCTRDNFMLFTPGTVIEAGHIKQMLDAGIEFVEVKDGEKAPAHSHELTGKEINRKLRNIFRDITLTNPLERDKIKETVNDLLRQVLRDRCVMVHLTQVRGSDSYIFTHSVNVCMLSLIIGLFLKLKKDQLKQLGLAALLHDVGRTRISKSILYKQSALSVEEFAEVKKHTVYGFEMLKNYNFSDTVTRTALQHHERMDGSGYPHGLCGEDIEFSARIVAVADVFDALLADRPFRKAFYPHEAVEIIINSSGQFDPEILKIFVDNVAIYPLGTVVALSSGEVGVVVDMNRGHQTRPVVRIMFDRDSQKLHFIKEVDLSKYRDIFITRILKEEQVENIIG